jgi:hypothetical protein
VADLKRSAKMKTPYALLSTKARGFALGSSTKPEDVIGLLGSPTDSWDDGVEHCISYRTETFELSLFWDVSSVLGVGRLKYRSLDLDFADAAPAFLSKND